MSVTNFRRASLKTGFPKSSDFADIPFTPPPAGDIIQTNLIRNYNAQNPASYPGTGTTWTDLMASGYNATLTNGPTYTAGTPNYFTTDGTNDRITAADTGMPAGAAARTIGCWIYPISNASAAYDAIGYGVNNGTFNAWVGGAMQNDTGYPPTPNFSINTYGPWVPTGIAGAKMTINAWQLIQFSLDGSGNYQFIVNDGVAANSYKTGTTTAFTTVLGGGFYLAWQGGAGFTAINARYGQYFAYSAAMTQANLQLNYTNTKALYGL